MQRFKGLLNFSLWLVLILIFSGCWDATKKTVDSDTGEFATFFVHKASGKSTETTNVSGNWEAPGTKTYQFRVCLKDVATKTDIRGRKFIIEDGTYVYNSETSNDSCVEWTENPLNFNYYAKSYYLVFERKIKAHRSSPDQGVRTVRFLVNPWAPYRKVKQNLEEVLYWPYESPAPITHKERIVSGAAEVSAALSGHSNELKDQAQLIVRNPVFQVTKKSDILSGYRVDKAANELVAESGYQLDATLKILPLVRVKNVNGEIVDLEVKVGRFKVFYEVVATDIGTKAEGSLVMTNDKTEVLTKNIPPIVSPILADGFIDAKTSFAVSKRVTDAKLKLAVRVLPMEAPGQIEPYDGLYVIGNHNSLVKGGSPVLESEKLSNGFNFLNFIQSTDDFGTLKKTYLAFDNRPFDFSIAAGTYETIAPGETATQRTVQFRTKTCVFDNALVGDRVKLRQFVVFRDGKKLPDNDAKTNEEGCFNFMGEVSHGFYQPERLIDVNYDIYAADTSVNGQAVTHKHGKKLFRLTVRVNPWDDKFTFFRDSRDVSEELAKSLTREKIDSRFFVSHFSYQTLRFGYDIDEYMNLTVKKTILLLIEPWVLRYSGIVAGRNNKQPIRDGIYLMKVAFQKDYLDPATKGVLIKRGGDKERTKNGGNLFVAKKWDEDKGDYVDLSKDKLNRDKKQYVSVVKKLVRANNGKIITPLEISISDLRLLRVRSQFLIQLEPIDERLLMVANQFDLKTTEQVKKDVQRRYDDMLQKIAEKKGQEEKEEFLEYLRFLAKDLSDVVKFRALSDEEEAEVQESIVAKQNELLSLINDIKKEQEKMQEKAENDQEAFRKILTLRNLYDEDLENELAKMDFTLMQAAPLVEDLNLLIEPKHISGLEARTFIGPLTFILNSNNSHVRPTDNLDEAWCVTDDCDSLKHYGLTAKGIFSKTLKGEYRNNKYYSSIKHMSGLHVEHPNEKSMPHKSLMDDFRQSRKHYKAEMEARSNINNLVNLYGYQFVSLRDEILKQVKPECTTIYRDDFQEACYEENKVHSLKSDEFFSRLNKNNNGPKIDKAEIRDMIKTGRMTENLSQQFCDLFIKQIFPDYKGGFNFEIPVINRIDFLKSDKIKLAEICDNASRPSAEHPAFLVERRFRVYEMGQNYVFNGGKQMNVNVGSNVSVSRDEKFSTGIGLSASTTQKPFSAVPGSFLSDVSGILRLSADYSRGKGNSESTVINEQTFLVMQTASFDLELTEYEQCAAVKWNPDIFSEYYFEIMHNLFADRSKRIEMPGGFFICSGIKEENTQCIRENYFYFIQFFTDGDMLDSGDLYNHPWLLALRGVRDASKFLSSLHKKDYVLTSLNGKLTDGPGWPIRQMVDTYLKVLPSFPKMYTVLDFYGQDYPRNQSCEETFINLDPTSLNMAEISESNLGIPGFSKRVDKFDPQYNGGQLPKALEILRDLHIHQDRLDFEK